MKAVISWCLISSALILASLFVRWLPENLKGAAVIGLLLLVNARLLWNLCSQHR